MPLVNGEYIHLGLANYLITFLNSNPSFNDNIIELSFNIDGLPLFKSSNTSLWPILGHIKNIKTDPFAVGIFCGCTSDISSANLIFFNAFP